MFYADDRGHVFFAHRFRSRKAGPSRDGGAGDGPYRKLAVGRRRAEAAYLVALSGGIAFLLSAFVPGRGIQAPLVVMAGLVAILPPVLILPWTRNARPGEGSGTKALHQLPRLHRMQTGHALLLLVAVVAWTVRVWGAAIALLLS